ncbi:hypothetical protein KF946_07875 [Idiomarina loihiensis]|uniref:DUF6990 domain-containing protein n=1 Tax=Idiomarina loihiensis TaxID=135577 RepID=UPI00129C80BE|nr:hypothetical protein [Idiomarina loihiensis]MRJ43380.1 hypothetical protein [Idiomarina loihiensis]UTW31956.1 hypothetical protein KF946_07875 [Idiomarina loihiensis]
MKKAEVIKYFKSHYPAENEGGGDWRFTLKDDEVGYSHIRPQLRGKLSNQIIGVSLVMAPRWYRSLMSAVLAKEAGFLFSTGDGNVYIKTGGEVTEAHLNEITQMALNWFRNCCAEDFIAPELKRKYEIYNRPGGWQYDHIIACILKGDIEKLQSYLDAFKRGDRMEFIPLIQQEYFERAIPLAEKYRSGERVSPVAF